MDDRLPRLLAGVPIETEHHLLIRLLIRCWEKNLVANDRHRTVATSGDGRLPQHIVSLTPTQRRILVRRRNAVTLRTTPPGPIGRFEFDGTRLWFDGNQTRRGRTGEQPRGDSTMEGFVHGSLSGR